MLHHVVGLAKAVGFPKAISILLRRAFSIGGRVPVRVGSFDLTVRPNDSDLAVISQVFGWKEYEIDTGRLAKLNQSAAAMKQEGLEPLIIDAGANVGYSALYFSQQFPGVKIIAVEPGQETYETLVRHTAQMPTITPVHAALWSHGDGLRFGAADGGSWGGKVSEGDGTPSTRLDTLVASVPNARVLLIKMDIEGAEKEVIESCPDLFAAAKCLLIEPHDFDYPGSACLAPLYKSIASRHFDTVLSGENLALFAADL